MKKQLENVEYAESFQFSVVTAQLLLPRSGSLSLAVYFSACHDPNFCTKSGFSFLAGECRRRHQALGGARSAEPKEHSQ